MTSETLRIPYRPKTWAMVAVAVVFGLAAWVWSIPTRAADAATPVEFYGLTVPGAVVQVSLWAILLFLVFLSAFGVIGTVRSFQPPSYVVIDATTITAPLRPISRQTVTIPLSEISRMRVTSYRGTTTLTLDHTDGRLVIDQRSLAKGVKVEDIVQAIEKRRT